MTTNTQIPCPFSNDHGAAVEIQNHIYPFIFILLLIGCPLNISGFIPSIVVNPLPKSPQNWYNPKMNEFCPDYVSPPGDTLHETLVTLNISSGELARLAGLPKVFIDEIILGKQEITDGVARKFEVFLGVPAAFWINRERQYREARLRLAREVDGP